MPPAFIAQETPPMTSSAPVFATNDLRLTANDVGQVENADEAIRFFARLLQDEFLGTVRGCAMGTRCGGIQVRAGGAGAPATPAASGNGRATKIRIFEKPHLPAQHSAHELAVVLSLHYPLGEKQSLRCRRPDFYLIPTTNQRNLQNG